LREELCRELVETARSGWEGVVIAWKVPESLWKMTANYGEFAIKKMTANYPVRMEEIIKAQGGPTRF